QNRGRTAPISLALPRPRCAAFSSTTHGQPCCEKEAGAPKTAVRDDLLGRRLRSSPFDHLDNLLALDKGLTGPAEIDPRQVQIVEMRFSAEMTSKEIAEMLRVGRMRPRREPE